MFVTESLKKSKQRFGGLEFEYFGGSDVTNKLLDLTKSGGTIYPLNPRFPTPLRGKPSQQLGNQQKLLIDMYCVDLLYQKCNMYVHTFVAKIPHAVNCSIKERFIIHDFCHKT